MNSMKNNQSGFASIIIAMVLILVLSLMTVGFAQLMQREQRSALDKQLSSQAYYAAESGVNDAVAAINNGFDTSKTTCAPYTSAQANTLDSGNPKSPASTYLTNNQVGADTGAKYTCLLINLTPTFIGGELQVGLSPKVFELSAFYNGSPEGIEEIAISWKSTNGNTFFTYVPQNASTVKFPPVGGAGAGDTGVIEAEVIPNNNISVSRQSLIDDAETFYLCPDLDNGGPTNCPNQTGEYEPAPSSINNNGFDSGTVLGGHCQTTAPGNNIEYYNCTSYIDFPTNQTTPPPDSVFIILRSLYTNSLFYLTVNNGNKVPLDIGNSVALIDSTGQAQDTLRRIQVEAPLQASYPVPGGSLGLNSICKQVEAAPTPSLSTTPGGTTACNPNLQY